MSEPTQQWLVTVEFDGGRTTRPMPVGVATTRSAADELTRRYLESRKLTPRGTWEEISWGQRRLYVSPTTWARDIVVYHDLVKCYTESTAKDGALV